MSTQVQFRRGTTAQNNIFTGAPGELTIDTDKQVVVVHNNSVAGGYPLLREDLSNLVPGTLSIVNADVNASAAIAYSKLNLSSSIVNADISATAAIAYTKLSLSGSIVDADVSASAAIADSKLATISTAGKVSGSAITSGTIGGTTAINTSGAIATTTSLAVGQTSVAANTDFDLAGTYAQTIVSVAALNIDCSTGNFFTKTINGASTFTFSNVPTSRAYSFTLEIVHVSGAISWPASVTWPNNTAPTLTTNRTHIFVFVTDDGGTKWRAASSIDYTT